MTEVMVLSHVGWLEGTSAELDSKGQVLKKTTGRLESLGGSG